MGDNIRTLRVTKFKGLNKSDNPHNIDDAEMTEMINAELTPNQTLISRKGYTKIGSATGADQIKTIFKNDWSNSDSRLYYIGDWALSKMNESTGGVTDLGLLAMGGIKPQFNRYKNKVVYCWPDVGLRWFNENESFDEIKYPQTKLYWSGFYPVVKATASAGGTLSEGTYYQYAICFLCGDDYRDGETSLSEPCDKIKMEGPSGHWISVPSNHIYALTTSANRIITGSAVPYLVSLYGFNITYVKLFRREAEMTTSGMLSGKTNWELIDEAFIEKVTSGSSEIYQLISNTRSNDDGTETTADTPIITAITGTYNATEDTANIYISFVDKGDGTPVNEQPYSQSQIVYPTPRYMTRLYNRILVANINSGQASDKKRIFYSYRPCAQGAVSEMADFYYDEPMMMFPYNNYFYCDAEDVNDEITGIHTFQDNVIIFTAHCTYVWTEGLAEPSKLSNDVGCIANDSVREFENCLVWLDTSGIYSWNGSKLENISSEKMQPYIDSFNKSCGFMATAVIYDRKYIISGAFNEHQYNDLVLVYDFDLEEWSTRQYGYDANNSFYIDALFKYNNGSSETLYAGGRLTDGTTIISKLDIGNYDNEAQIAVTLKTKYYDLGAPDILKIVRNSYIDIENYAGNLTVDIYIDNLSIAKSTINFSQLSNEYAVIMNDPTTWINDPTKFWLVNLSDELIGFSHPLGLRGSRFQYGISFNAGSRQTKIHMFGVDWLPKSKTKRRYGG